MLRPTKKTAQRHRTAALSISSSSSIVDPAALKSRAQSKTLMPLQLSELSPLASLTSLQTLNLSGCRQLTDLFPAVMRLRKSWARHRNRGPPVPPVERGEATAAW